MKLLFALVTALLLAPVTHASDLEFAPRKYAEVSAGIARSGRPTNYDLTALKQDGFKTILSFEKLRDGGRKEGQAVEKLGMNYFTLPMSTTDVPPDADVDRALELMADPASHPILVHCLHGEDRTGMMVGLYRVLKEGKTPADAYREMLDLGFHPAYTDLVKYFERRTNWRH